MDETRFGHRVDASAPCEPLVRGPTAAEHVVLLFKAPAGSRTGRRLAQCDRRAAPIERVHLSHARPPGDVVSNGDARAVLIPRREAESLDVERYRAIDVTDLTSDAPPLPPRATLIRSCTRTEPLY